MKESIKLSFEKQKINLPVVDKVQSILIVCRDKKLSREPAWVESWEGAGVVGLHDLTVRLVDLVATIKTPPVSSLTGLAAREGGREGVVGVE